MFSHFNLTFDPILSTHPQYIGLVPSGRMQVTEVSFISIHLQYRTNVFLDFTVSNLRLIFCGNVWVHVLQLTLEVQRSPVTPVT